VVKALPKIAYINQQDWFSRIAEKKFWCCGFCFDDFVACYVLKSL
jgi:hypothetical protein